MVKTNLPRSCYNVFNNLQLQSRLPGASQHHWMLSCAPVPKRFVTGGCKPTTLHQIDQHSRSERASFLLGTLCKIVKSSSRYSPPAHFANLLRACQFFNLTFSSANRAIQSGDVWCTFADLIFQKCSEHAIFLKFEMQIESKRALATVLCTFCRQLSQIAGRTRRNRHPTSAMKEATLPEIHTRFCAQNIFNPWIHAFPNCYSAPTRELLLLTICCHDAGLPFVRNSEVF